MVIKCDHMTTVRFIKNVGNMDSGDMKDFAYFNRYPTVNVGYKLLDDAADFENYRFAYCDVSFGNIARIIRNSHSAWEIDLNAEMNVLINDLSIRSKKYQYEFIKPKKLASGLLVRDYDIEFNENGEAVIYTKLREGDKNFQCTLSLLREGNEWIFEDLKSQHPLNPVQHDDFYTYVLKRLREDST